jgi:hypothetical protein
VICATWNTPSQSVFFSENPSQSADMASAVARHHLIIASERRWGAVPNAEVGTGAVTSSVQLSCKFNQNHTENIL